MVATKPGAHGWPIAARNRRPSAIADVVTFAWTVPPPEAAKPATVV